MRRWGTDRDAGLKNCDVPSVAHRLLHTFIFAFYLFTFYAGLVVILYALGIDLTLIIKWLYG